MNTECREGEARKFSIALLGFLGLENLKIGFALAASQRFARPKMDMRRRESSYGLISASSKPLIVRDPTPAPHAQLY
jgi:hypothetical protein